MNPAVRLAPLLLLAGSCGYEVGSATLYPVRDIRIEIFDTLSDRRTHEIDLTDAIIHEMSARGFRVNRKDATHTLRGKILEIRTPSVVESGADVVLVGSLLFRIEASLARADGTTAWKDARTETVAFSATRRETFESARQEVFDRLARWVVSRLEKEW